MPSETYTKKWRCPCGAGVVEHDTTDYGNAYSFDFSGRIECGACAETWKLDVGKGYFRISSVDGRTNREVEGFLERI
jgi:hypothetical protein